MPDVRNCKRCNKIFNYLGGAQICPICKEADEADFRKVKDYLYDNPGATMSQISMELGISVEKITRYLREGRLEIVDNNGNLVLECEKCGKSIRTGRYCEECTRELSRSFSSTANEMKNKLAPPSSPSNLKSEKVAMRYLGKIIKE